MRLALSGNAATTETPQGTPWESPPCSLIHGALRRFYADMTSLVHRDTTSVSLGIDFTLVLSMGTGHPSDTVPVVGLSEAAHHYL